MATKDDIEKINEVTKEVKEPEIECFFCIDRSKHNFWHFTEVTDPFIKEYFVKDSIIDCDHKKMNEPSIWFADFMACSLLEYVFENHLERQTDVPFLEKTIRNGTIMIPSMEKRIKIDGEEFPLEHFDEPTRTLMKGKRKRFPKFIEIAKKMYQIGGLEIK